MEISLEEAIEYLLEIKDRSSKFNMIYPSNTLEMAIVKVIEEINNGKRL